MKQSPDHDQIVGILLAAGRGTRFDPSGAQNKLLQTTLQGDKVVVAAASKLLAALPQVTAVVRNADDAVARELAELGCQLAICPDADQGMGVSLVCALTQRRHAAGWVIALADMPHVQAKTIAALAEALKQGADMVAPFYQGQRGNPVAFSSKHIDELLQLGGDQGARTLLKTHPLTQIEVDDPGIHHDIDTSADLKAAV